MMRLLNMRFAIGLTIGLFAVASLHGAEKALPTKLPDQPTFETHIRPLLKAHCLECHGDAEKPKAGLDLRLQRMIVQGGKNGPALVVGKPDVSSLFTRVR